MVRANTIHPNDCGNCKHWHERAKQDYCIFIGDCDKIPKGTQYEWIDRRGKSHTDMYCGYSFEDECYDEDFRCFEGIEE